MADPTLVDLESAIKKVPGVLGCVIMADPEGAPSEIQAFTGPGSDVTTIQKTIEEEVAQRGLGGSLRNVFVFELEAESHFGDRETLERAAELAEQDALTRGPMAGPSGQLLSLQEHLERPDGAATDGTRARPPLLRVSFASTQQTSEASVALGGATEGDDEVIGEASGEKTPHGLMVLAQATLEAVTKLLGDADLDLRGASLVSIVGQEAVLVVVAEKGGPDMLGAALVRGGPTPEAAVRATLDAVNRRLTQG